MACQDRLTMCSCHVMHRSLRLCYNLRGTYPVWLEISKPVKHILSHRHTSDSVQHRYGDVVTLMVHVSKTSWIVDPKVRHPLTNMSGLLLLVQKVLDMHVNHMD